MTRSELIFRLASRFPQLLRQDAEMVVIEILGAISTALIRGERSEIRGFGSFALNYRAPPWSQPKNWSVGDDSWQMDPAL